MANRRRTDIHPPDLSPIRRTDFKREELDAPPASLSNRSWVWACSALWNKQNPAVPVQIVDTVIVNDAGILTSWLSFGQNNTLVRRPRSHVTPQNILKVFTAWARAQPGNENDYAAVVSCATVSELMVLTCAQLKIVLLNIPIEKGEETANDSSVTSTATDATTKAKTVTIVDRPTTSDHLSTNEISKRKTKQLLLPRMSDIRLIQAYIVPRGRQLRADPQDALGPISLRVEYNPLSHEARPSCSCFVYTGSNSNDNYALGSTASQLDTLSRPSTATESRPTSQQSSSSRRPHTASTASRSQSPSLTISGSRCASSQLHGRNIFRSLNPQINAKLSENTFALVSAIETNRRMTVASLTAEYLIDTHQRVWLVRTSELFTQRFSTPLSPTRRMQASQRVNLRQRQASLKMVNPSISTAIGKTVSSLHSALKQRGRHRSRSRSRGRSTSPHRRTHNRSPLERGNASIFSPTRSPKRKTLKAEQKERRSSQAHAKRREMTVFADKVLDCIEDRTKTNLIKPNLDLVGDINVGKRGYARSPQRQRPVSPIVIGAQQSISRRNLSGKSTDWMNAAKLGGVKSTAKSPSTAVPGEGPEARKERERETLSQALHMEEVRIKEAMEILQKLDSKVVQTSSSIKEARSKSTIKLQRQLAEKDMSLQEAAQVAEEAKAAEISRLPTTGVGHSCAGDFCDVLIQTIWEEGNSSVQQKDEPLSTQKIQDIQAAGKLLPQQLQLKQQQEERKQRMTMSIEAGKLNGDKNTASDANDTEKGRANGVGGVGTGPGTNTEPEEVLENYVLFKTIAQAREEHHLVTLLLRRLGKNQKSDYLSAESTPESFANLLGQVFPAQYYRQVKVCDNCHMVYSTIDAARNASISRHSASTGNVGSYKRTARHMRTKEELVAGAGQVDATTGEPAIVDDRTTELSSPRQHLEARACRLAAGILTKSHLAELRGLVNPPSGALYVCEAVMLMLTGNVLAWDECKRLMINGDRFLNMLRDVDIYTLPHKRLAMLAEYFKNQSFRPDIVRQVSAAAAAFCSWIVGSLKLHMLMNPDDVYDGAWPESIVDVLSTIDMVEHIGKIGGKLQKRLMKVSKQKTEPDATEIYRDAVDDMGTRMRVAAPSFVTNGRMGAGRKASMTSFELSLSDRLKMGRVQRERKRVRIEIENSKQRSELISGDIDNNSEFGSSSTCSSDDTDDDQDDASKKRKTKEEEDDDELSEFRQDLVGLDDKDEWQDVYLGPKGLSLLHQQSMAPVHLAFNRHESGSPRNEMIGMGKRPRIPASIGLNNINHDNNTDDSKDTTKEIKSNDEKMREKRAKRKVQERQMARLHQRGQVGGSGGGAGGGDEEEGDGGGGNMDTRIFSCSDEVTSFPYQVIGTTELEGKTPNLIIIHDLFDTLESSQIFLEGVLRRKQGCQALVFNYPGQAHTYFPGSAGPVGLASGATTINNEFVAACIHELLQSVEKTGEFVTSYKPFYIVGFGNGANVAAMFALEYGRMSEYRKRFAGILSINGFAHVDRQLAAVLHSSSNVFSCFPPSRPDLPVSYFTRFLFSDEYLKRVDPNLVLNLYTAVANPITLQGRVALCNGALKHKRIAAHELTKLSVPIIAIQSTDNVLVNPNNVDAFLEGRSAAHLWSHQLSEAGSGSIGEKGEAHMRATLAKKNGTFVVWIKAGHEVRQECRAQVLDVIDKLISTASEDPSATATLPQATSVRNSLSGSVSSKRSFRGRENVTREKLLKKAEVKEEEEKEQVAVSGKEESDFDAAMKKHKQVKLNRKKQHAKRMLLEEEQAQEKMNKNNRKQEAKDKKEREMEEQKTQMVAVLNGEEDGNDVALELKEDVAAGGLFQHAADMNSNIPASSTSEQNAEGTDMSESDQVLASSTSVESEAMELDADEIAIRDKIRRLKGVQEARRMQWETENQKQLDRLQQELELSKKERDTQNDERWQKVEQDMFNGKAEEPVEAQVQHGVEIPTVSTHEVAESKEQVAPQVVQTFDKHDVQVVKVEQIKQEQLQQQQQQQPEIQKQKQLQQQQQQQRQQQRQQQPENQKQKQKQQQQQQQQPDQQQHEQQQSKPNPEQQFKSQYKQQLKPKPAQEPVVAAVVEKIETPDEVVERKRAEAKEKVANDIMNQIPEPIELANVFDGFADEEEKMREMGILKLEEYEKVKQEMKNAELARLAMLENLKSDEVRILESHSAARIQRLYRGHRTRVEYHKMRYAIDQERIETEAAAVMQSIVRGKSTRMRVKTMRSLLAQEVLEGESLRLIQRVERGRRGRLLAKRAREERSVRTIQRVGRGRQGRLVAHYEKSIRDARLAEIYAATKIQATYRMFDERERYLVTQLRELAAGQVQRVYRGVRGRRKARRRREWQKTKPGPERIQLGIKLIEESRTAFDSQQEEIAALHRAQERAEAEVNKVHAGLRESERELSVLEQELQDVDHLDRTVRELTHQRAELDKSPDKIATQGGGITEPVNNGGDVAGGGGGASAGGGEGAERRAAQAYALEMAIHVKRAERERRKKALEAEFAGVYQEVGMKKEELARLEENIQVMEATRKRKEREFQRLQRNLMELLEEQKQELDSIREKGIELETATATSAAAAAATAHKAKENAKRSQEMFSSTEELMKFQFMSMSLSYFSSLNMLKSLRDMNADTSTSAIATSADTAAAAAAASAAAGIPELSHLNISGASELLDAAASKRREAQIDYKKRVEEAKAALAQPFPDDVTTWTVDDVCRWLDTLSLSQYKESFKEASVDGAFLLDLRPEDMRDVLGMSHTLHVQKVVVMLNKIRPLGAIDRGKRDQVVWEKRGDAAREAAEREAEENRVPDLDKVFSMIRNGRVKRVEEALNLGFAVDAVDIYGNSALIISCQNLNKRISELLLNRGADIGLRNNQGNTPLHYAMAYDPEGAMGEFLIGRGADDTIENKLGLSPYDGIE